MENFLSARISRAPLITGVYDRFVVDFLDADATFRGYVCAVEKDHCMVRVGSMQQLRRIPMDKLHLADYSERRCLNPQTTPEEIDVLISVEDNQPESWQPARIISGSSIHDFSLLYIEASLPGDVFRQYYVLDSFGAPFRRIRPRGNLGEPFTPQSFIYQEVALSEIKQYCNHFADTLHKVQGMPRFRSRFMQKNCGIAFLSATDYHIAVLVQEEYNHTLTVYGINIAKVIASTVDQFVGKFTQATAQIADTVLKELITRIVVDLDLRDPHEFHFEELLTELSMEVFSFLDVYDQNQLRRTCKSFHRRLSRKSLRQCVILPNLHKHAIETLGVSPSGSDYRNLAHIVGNTISQDAKILYFAEDWEESLFTLAQVLIAMHVKLSWLVIANNFTLALNEFLPFPKRSPMLLTYDFITLHGNHLCPHSAPNYTHYASICRHLVLKNCCFDSRLSLCFRKVLSLENGWSDQVIGPGRWHLRCCHDPFFIVIPRWCYRFTETVTSTFEASFRSALEDHCPVLEGPKIENLVLWLNSLTSESCTPRCCIWPYITLSYKLWDEKPPKHCDEVIADICRRFSPKSCIMQTLVLLLPCIIGEFCCVADAVDD
ncbi:uncharacterized protein LOC129596422 [Paramacrobiotus metropolitanus]|uniref:uncharacterized protein LOC129596422 n=1 Tax=Paramacrobiotus metropolitanus TaxID=2943436 RepID=UPI002446184D|nr:uncharacterized protein LOC129596422 [Paramacrobiotus metropolitanus]